MRTLISNARGFSLPEVMVGIGLMGGISLITMKLVEDQKGNEIYIRGNTEIQKAVSNVKNALADPENCRQALAGVDLSNPLGYTITSIKMTVKSLNAEKIILDSNSKDYEGIETRIFRVIPPAVGAPANVATLELNFKLKNRNTKFWKSANEVDPNEKIITERIPILVTRNGNVVTDCGAVISGSNDIAKEKFCKTLGGAAVWNSGTKTCTYNDHRCPVGQVMVSMTSLGNPICDDIKDHINLNDLFDETQCESTGKFSIIDNGSGKLKINCVP